MDDDTDYSIGHIRALLADKRERWERPAGYWMNAAEALLEAMQRPAAMKKSEKIGVERQSQDERVPRFVEGERVRVTIATRDAGLPVAWGTIGTVTGHRQSAGGWMIQIEDSDGEPYQVAECYLETFHDATGGGREP